MIPFYFYQIFGNNFKVIKFNKNILLFNNFIKIELLSK